MLDCPFPAEGRPAGDFQALPQRILAGEPPKTAGQGKRPNNAAGAVGARYPDWRATGVSPGSAGRGPARVGGDVHDRRAAEFCAARGFFAEPGGNGFPGGGFPSGPRDGRGTAG